MVIDKEFRKPNLALMWGVFGAIVILLVALAAYFLISHHIESQQRLNTLQQSIEAQINKRLQIEVDDAANYVEQQHHQAEQILREESRSQVKQALAVARSIYKQNIAAHSEAEVKTMILEALREVRFFNGRGYVFIGDREGNSLLLPPAPSLEGSSMYDLKDDQGNFFVRRFLEIINSETGSGYAEYRWYPPEDKAQMKEKVTYIELFEPYHWLVGAGDYLYQIQRDQQRRILNHLSTIRFGDDGYLAVFDRNGVLLSGQGLSEFAGMHLSQLQGRVAKETFSRILALADTEGFHRADWYRLDGSPAKQQLLYIKPLSLWGWTILAGGYSDASMRLLEQERIELERHGGLEIAQLLLSLLFVLGVALYTTQRYSRWLKRSFNSFQSNIDKQNQALQANAKSLEVSARIVDAAHEGIMLTDAQSRIIRINDSFTRITGYSFDEVKGKNPRMLSSERQDERFYETMWQTLQSKGRWQGELWNKRKNGDLFPQLLSITTYCNTAGEVENYIGTFTDISLRKSYEEQMEHMAQYDSLTDLANRRMLSIRLHHEIAVSKRDPNYRLAVIFIDLDHFKQINDTYGHGIGDQVLITTARRLSEAVREVDLVSRIGGDEFVVLMGQTGKHIHASVANFAERIIESLSRPFTLAGEELQLTPTIGIAVYPDDGMEENTLLKNADTAMYQAKQQGRNTYQFFDQRMSELVSNRLVMEKELKQAISQQALQLHYQPQYSIRGGELIGFEALLRWPDKMGMLLMPEQFIPLAEETGLIVPLGEWVLKTACLHAQQWSEQSPRQLSVAVNISGRQLNLNFPDQVAKAITESGISPQMLILEIKETALIQQELETIQEILQQIHRQGVRISIDDFATKQSSLGYLARLPIDQLKIDRDFVRHLPGESSDASITSSILSLAHKLNIRTLAEGVETAEQRDYLIASGCDESQGFLYSRAVPLEKVASLIQREHVHDDISDPELV